MSTQINPRKEISERRRQQNKQAQKKYRERQKRNLEILQGIASSKVGLVIDQEGKNGEALQTVLESCTNELAALDDTPLRHPDVLIPSYSSFLGSEFHRQSCAATELSDGEDPGFPATNHSASAMHTWIQERSQILLNPMLHTEKPPASSPGNHHIHDRDDHGNLPPPEYDTFDNKLKDVGERFTVEQILEAGLKTLSHGFHSQEALDDVDEECPSHDPLLRTDKIIVFLNPGADPIGVLPDLRRNHFRVKQVMWVAACVANASQIGLAGDDTSCEDATSPFFQHGVSEEAAKVTCQTAFRDLKENLRPLPLQLMHQHHPYIDVLPFPTFRERLLKLVCMDPPMIDEDDLATDFENDGLICWGSSLGGGNVATGSGTPWDIRSWEAQPWFLRKWWILIGGSEGELYKQTQWWREMRGERSCNPW